MFILRLGDLHSQRDLDIPGNQWELDPQMPLRIWYN